MDNKLYPAAKTKLVREVKKLTYHILLLFKSKLFSLLRSGNPSSLRMSFSEKSIESN